MVVLAHLQGAAATFRVGRHHHRGPLHEGRGLTHALTHTAPTDLTVAAALVRKAYSKRRRSCLWSKPVNLRTWRLVSDPIAMVQALAELRYGVVVHTRENSVKYGLNFNQTPYRFSLQFHVQFSLLTRLTGRHSLTAHAGISGCAHREAWDNACRVPTQEETSRRLTTPVISTLCVARTTTAPPRAMGGHARCLRSVARWNLCS